MLTPIAPPADEFQQLSELEDVPKEAAMAGAGGDAVNRHERI